MVGTVAVVAPVLHRYEYADVPPDAVAVADPSDPPWQDTLLWEEMEALKTTGSVIVTELPEVHP